MTIEMPINFKKNLLQHYKLEPISEKDFFQGCPGKENIFAKMLYVLSFFHVLVQERKKYGYLGWSIPYEFSEYNYHLLIKQLKVRRIIHSELLFKNNSLLLQKGILVYICNNHNNLKNIKYYMSILHL